MDSSEMRAPATKIVAVIKMYRSFSKGFKNVSLQPLRTSSSFNHTKRHIIGYMEVRTVDYPYFSRGGHTSGEL
jgi:hypothetical protein